VFDITQAQIVHHITPIAVALGPHPNGSRAPGYWGNVLVRLAASVSRHRLKDTHMHAIRADHRRPTGLRATTCYRIEKRHGHRTVARASV